MSDHLQGEIAFLGITSSSASLRAREGNGCIDRFFRTLEEQLLWTFRFQNAEEVREAVAEWLRILNERWLIARHGHRAPAAIRRELVAIKVPA